MSQRLGRRRHDLSALVQGDGGASLLSTSTMTELRALLAVAGNGTVADERLRVSAAAIVNDARRGDVRVEEMLIRLKAEWMPLIDEEGLAWTERVRDLTSRLVTHCISAYYAPTAGGGAESGH